VLLAAAGGSGIASAQKGIELWPYLLGTALLCLLLEQSVRRVGTTPRRTA
jgi:hypothetical protein